MTLNKIQKNKALEHLNSKWSDKTCNICRESNWEVHPELYELRQFNEGNMVLGGPVVPLLIVECTNCGNTISINAMRAGVVSPDRDSGDKNDRK